MVDKFNPPPSPSTPRDAPWTQLEVITDRLDTLISILSGGVIQPETGVPQLIDATNSLIEVTNTLVGVTRDIYDLVKSQPTQVITQNGTTATQITVSTPLPHAVMEWGTATYGSKNKLIYQGKSWATNIWAGYEVAIVDGNGVGQVRRIISNDRTSLTTQTDFDINPDNTSVFVIRAYRTLSNKPAWTNATKTVAAAGTAEQLPDLEVPDGFALAILALSTNTGYIYFGNSKANTETHINRVSADFGITLNVNNTNLVWIDSSVNGEGVVYFFEQNG
ncbi:MAG: hypothetical protein PHQ43_01270 [Dehalococcoidales bacterium]|nr:hypothetical protein [Dehalococcoidales bacterium]